ncbi:hypothetical protein [Streptomyces buecherae]|uniref:hypothetical protein n=1 Tax=Streptomyces buecherae TaxID=2763006 RepID=UPI0037900991
MKGLTWVVWRQHRATAWTVLALTAVAAACLGYWFHDQWAFQHDHGIAGCDILLPTCQGVPTSEWEAVPHHVTAKFENAYRDTLVNAGQALRYVPLLVAAFIGAPLFARDFETGAYRVALAQSISPRRWLAAKLAHAVTLTLLATTVLTALYGWWWHSTWRDFGSLVWNTPVPMLTAGPAAVAVAVLAAVLGATIGLLVRRTVPAMAISLAVCGGLIYRAREVDFLHHLLSPISARTALGSNSDSDVPRYSRHDGWWYETSSGERLDLGVCPGVDAELTRCLNRHDVVAVLTEYHPASAYWPIQWIVAGICLTVAAALVAGCLWWGGRRTA